MYFVKEYDEEGSYIGSTEYCHEKEAVDLFNRIRKYQPEIKASVHEINYDNEGKIFENIKLHWLDL